MAGFKLEIQRSLANIFWGNVNHHGWSLKKILIFSNLKLTLNCIVFIEIKIKVKLVYPDLFKNALIIDFSHTSTCNLKFTSIFWKSKSYPIFLLFAIFTPGLTFFILVFKSHCFIAKKLSKLILLWKRNEKFLFWSENFFFNNSFSLWKFFSISDCFQKQMFSLNFHVLIVMILCADSYWKRCLNRVFSLLKIFS